MVPWQTPERQTPERQNSERQTPERLTPERLTPERQTPDKTNSWKYKLLKIQTPEIMKFFSEWNMIKFINFRRKNPQIS